MRGLLLWQASNNLGIVPMITIYYCDNLPSTKENYNILIAVSSIKQYGH